MLKLWVLVFGLTFATSSFAIGSIVAVTVFGFVAGTFAYAATAFAINMIVSAVISKAFLQSQQSGNDLAGNSPNPGNRQQIAPATDNKLSVVYGSAYVGGTVTDLSITSDNQSIYYVLSLTEVTNNGSDVITFGDIYYGGKKVIFQGNGYTVASLLDESTSVSDDKVNGLMNIYLYSNGSATPTNSGLNAIQVMQSSGLIYTWDNTKLMTNCAFAIIQLNYNSSAGVTNLQQTKFQITNSRKAPGDCILDYLTNEVYGASIPLAQIDTTSLSALNIYSNQVITYTPYSGGSATQKRFQFDGVIDTNRSIMQNLQDMASCCDVLLKYNEILGLWGVIVQTPTYTVVMDINDSNMVSALQVTPLDISASFNVAEVKFPDGANQDAFNSVTIDLATIQPSLLYPNEPVNKQSISLPLVNNNVRSQYLTNRFLKSAREDLQVQCQINFSGLQLEAGDVVTVTNSKYGWVAKLFRLTKVTEEFSDSGAVTASLLLSEYNPTVYDDANITQFTPSPNTGIGDPTFFGTVPSPIISSVNADSAIPVINVQITTSSSGITQYAEVWYSTFNNGTNLIFAGTSEIQPNGNPWDVNYVLPIVSVSNVQAGNWYFYTRMVNSLASSVYSSPSTVVNWRPMTFQYIERYLSIAYANDAVGTGLSSNPSGKTYFGVANIASSVFITSPSTYKWYLANPAFSTNNYFLYNARGRNLVSFGVGEANYAAGTGVFVPSDTLNYDPSVWQALPNGLNIIDLVQRSGQLIQTGTTTVGTGEIAVTNNSQGQVIASLAQLLNFGGAYTKTSAVANLTIDIYGRVVGFEAPDSFYYSMIAYDASASQTVFTVTRSARYVVGNCLVFQNGLLLDTSEYTDASGLVTLAVGANLDDIVTIISMASVNSLLTTYNSFTRYTETLTNQASITITGFTLVSGYELMFLNGTVINAQDYNISGQDITFVTACSGDLQIIQWANNNLGVPNGTPVNIDQFTIVGQSLYTFSYNPLAFNLYSNGVLLLETQDFTVATGTYTLATTPTNNTTIIVQQTFERTGAV